MRTGTIRIRPGCASDLETIVEYNLRLARETEGLALDRETVRAGVRAALDDPHKGRYLVAEMNGRAVGQLMLTTEWSDWRNGPMWWIQSVYVHPDHRGRGVFRALFETALREARASGVRTVRLYVEEGNDVAREVYTRLGMEWCGYLVYEIDLRE